MHSLSDTTSAKNVTAQVRLTIALCWLLMAAEVLRLGPAFVHWAQGVPPAYPHQYASRVLNGIMGVSLIGSCLVIQSARSRRTSGRVLYWTLIGVSALALGVLVVSGW